MLSFTELLGKTVAALDTDGADPDGPVIRQGLLLAAHAGLTVDRDTDGTSHWDLYSVSVGEAVAALHADLPDKLLLATDVPDAGVDDHQLRMLVRMLVGRLADRYAAAAAESGGTPEGRDDARRHLVWAEVAHRLDAAAAQLH
jgi:hypothetical protein